MKQVFCLALCVFAFLALASADVEVGEKDWEQTLASNRQTIVKFYSPHCGWCQKFAPLWTELTNAFDGVLAVVAVDVTVHKTLAAEQGISGVPTVKLYNGKTWVADYKGPREQMDMANWIFSRLTPIKIEYNTKAWSQFTQNNYAAPVRFMYIYAQGENPDTSKLSQAVRVKGIFAECEIPTDQVASFLESYNVKSLPLFASVNSGAFTSIKSNEIDLVIEGQGNAKANQRRFGDGSITGDSHGAFTFLFFLCGIIGLAVFAWKKLAIPKMPRESSKMV